LCTISFQILNKLVSMGTNLDITIDEFLTKLQMNEITYILRLQCTWCKPTLFFKTQTKCTNIFSRHWKVSMGSNTYAQCILDIYVDVTYCTSYLTQVDKSIACEMQYILDKCKFEETQTFEQIKKIRKCIF
jgi:hypothetical protein